MARPTGPSYQSHARAWGPLDLSWRPGLADAGLRDLTTRAGLRGRGGGWFPTGRKMDALVAGAAGAEVCLVANAMESEPASRSDEWLLGNTPHLVLDGMQVAAQAIGAQRATIAVHDTHGAAGILRQALDDRPWDAVPIDLSVLPSRYVSSEETALARGVGGDLALPAYRVRPHERGVNGNPTMVSNAESLAHLALIGRWGADWFRQLGTAAAPGTALISAGGAFSDPGTHEVALGQPVVDVIDGAGGTIGSPTAFLIGGYGGQWVSAADLYSTTWDPEALRARGLRLGAGVLWALPEGYCGLIETARVVTYMAGESAGQCGPCRFGLSDLADSFTELALGRDTVANQAAVERLFPLIARRGGCAHPDGVVGLVASALAVFESEVAAHTAGTCTGHAGELMLPIPEVRERPAPLPDRSWRPVEKGSPA